MPRIVSLHLDEEADQAMQILTATGMTPSQAIRTSLVGEAQRYRRKSSRSAEIAALETDDEDSHEMLAVTDLMESLRSTG